MQGSVAGYLWVHNDRSFRQAEFGRNALYWKSRLRATAFAFVYSTQFEIGPVSEASIGAIQARYPQQGVVDHVITPVFGMGWMVAEDAIDKYLVERIEAATGNVWLRLLARGGLNPSRTFANVLTGNVPWHRDTRAGIRHYRQGNGFALVSAGPTQRSAGRERDESGVPAFEFSTTFRSERMWGASGNRSCVGGGATGAFRLSPGWQFIVDAGGCQFMGMEPNLSGDSFTYMLGLRRVYNASGSWSAHGQFLVGGNKLTEERFYPEKKKQEDASGVQPPARTNGAYPDYLDHQETNAFGVAAGGGVNYRVNRALAVNVVDLQYRRAWLDSPWREYSNGLKLSAGVVLRVGNW
jgi:hypothetical protein